jgi:hypothetical protein
MGRNLWCVSRVGAVEGAFGHNSNGNVIPAPALVNPPSVHHNDCGVTKALHGRLHWPVLRYFRI